MRFMAALLICALAAYGGWCFGKRLNERHVVAARVVVLQTKSVGLVTPPLSPVPPQVYVAELPDGVLRLPATVVVGAHQNYVDAGALEPKFFDFHRAVCDTAESVRGSVLRCSLPKEKR